MIKGKGTVSAMRKSMKRNLLAMMNTLQQALQSTGQIIMQKDTQSLMDILTQLQEAMIQVGNTLEQELPKADSQELINWLEQGCEDVWQCSQAKNEGEQIAILLQLNDILSRVADRIAAQPIRKVVAFFPYKASMWECMESVWMAASEDKECDTYVVPIPYFDLQDGQVKARHYEGTSFPSYVPITDYRNFPLEEYLPDMAYVHNPFDEYNKITSVLPQFYSAALRQYVEKLIYIPYFVTGEAVFVTHRELPSYYIVDYIVTQTEKMIESYAATIPQEKFLPFGSPVADRIIRLETEKPSIPEAWKSMLPNGKDFGGCRTIMLNTSISLLLREKDRFLDKLQYLFTLTEKMKGLLLIWRPHPLLMSSARMVSEALADRLQALEDIFLARRLGVLDKSADVGVTVALCDAYLGETASSLIHMFGIAGKPRFYLNLVIPQKAEGDTCSCCISGSCEDKDTRYYLLDEWNWIVAEDMKNGIMKPLVYIPGSENVAGRSFCGLEKSDSELRVKLCDGGIFIYNLADGSRRKRYTARITESYVMEEKEPLTEITLTEVCMAEIIAEKFKRGNLNHEWHEGEKTTIEDYLYFLQTAEAGEMTGYLGNYQVWLNSLDGTCGKKIHEAVKNSLKNNK